MKVHVITDVTVCFDAEIPNEEIEDYQNERGSELFQTAWHEWYRLTNNLSLPFELDAEGSEIFSIVNADTGETIYGEEI